ncbi:MAG: T9SS type A sorting domain-containing protein [Bacteroidia bacterium]|nr:T9SS type A sorting domain-containing protein [Bacteroidia bacterium]
MKRFWWIYICFVWGSSFGQDNLLQNHGFEEYITCPTNNSEGYFAFPKLPYWNDTSFFGSPDYFNSCSISEDEWWPFPVFGVPKCYHGFQYAKEGNAFAGIITYKSFEPNIREYLISRFISPLVNRKKYLVSFYVSPADTFKYATSRLAALITDGLPMFTTNLYNSIPQIVNNSMENPLTNLESWTLVQDTFEAGGGENYIIIGNFFDTENSDTSTINSGSNYQSFSYYFIDDVSVIELDTSIGIYEKELDHFQFYPNPAQNTIAFKNKAPVSISIYSLSGAHLLSKNIRKDEEIDIRTLSNGVYIVAIGNKRERLVVCR